MEAFVKGLAEAGINVVVGSGSISDVALHYFEKYNVRAGRQTCSRTSCDRRRKSKLDYGSDIRFGHRVADGRKSSF